MRVLVDEFVSAGGLPAEQVPASLAREGRAMRDAIRTDFAALDEVDVVAVPEGSTVSFADRLAEALGGCDAAIVVAPEFDGILRRVHDSVMTAGVRWIGCDPESIAICSDKLRTHEWLVENGIATIPTQPCLESPTRFANVGGPWILKPRDGAGSLDIRLVEDAAGIASASRPRDVLQPFVRGEAISIAAIVRSARDYDLLPVARQRLDPATFGYLGGTIPYDVPAVRGDAYGAVARRLVEGLGGLGGYVGIDLLLPDENPNEPIVVEINPRLTTSYLGYRALADENLAARMLGPVRGPLAFRTGIVEFDAVGPVELRATTKRGGAGARPHGVLS